MRDRILINENLSLVSARDGAVFACSCGHTLAPGDANFKNGCAVRESAVDSIGPGYTSFATEMMRKMCFREFFCPACGARLAAEVARVGDEYLWDIEVRL